MTPYQVARVKNLAGRIKTAPKNSKRQHPRWAQPSRDISTSNRKTATDRQNVEITMGKNNQSNIHKNNKAKQQRRTTKMKDIASTTQISPPTRKPKTKQGKFHSFMCPRGPALDHPFAETLLSYAEMGCTVDCGEPWSMERIEQAITRGAHTSAREPKVAEYAWKEAQEKEAKGFYQIYKWSTLRKSCPVDLKISPLAAIPYKSRAYRLLLDLSFGLKMNGQRQPSVNETTIQTAPHHALDYIGTALPRIIHAVATAAISNHCLFAKADIKDGFWRVFIEDLGQWKG